MTEQHAPVSAPTTTTDDPAALMRAMLEDAAKKWQQEQHEESILRHLPQYETLSAKMAGTPAAPEWIQKTKDPEATTLAVMMKGAELGIPPMHALASIYLVEGRVGLSAELMRALMIRAGVRLTWKEHSATRAELLVERVGHPPFTAVWTIDMAVKAGLANNERKPTWQRYPEAMLIARCTSLGGRTVCPDILGGCYSKEELDDMASDAESLAPVGARPPQTLDDIAAAGKKKPSTKPAQPPLDITELLLAISTVTTEKARAGLIESANAMHQQMSAEQQAEVKAALLKARERIAQIKDGADPREVA